MNSFELKTNQAEYTAEKKPNFWEVRVKYTMLPNGSEVPRWMLYFPTTSLPQDIFRFIANMEREM